MHPQPHEFEFAVICALPCEFNAFDALFDEHYTNLATKRHHGDSNFYQTGRIGALNVVLTCLSEMGKTRAANAASGIRFSFPNVSLTLVVGICGGVPFPTKDTEMVLGDVIISDQVVKYDFGRQYPDRFEQKGVVKSILDPRNEQVQSLLSGLQTRRMRDRFQEKHTGYLQALHRDPLWKYPGIDRDQLYSSSCQHNSSSEGCTGERIVRQRLNTGLNPQPCLHFGAIASGDTVMKSAEYRDSLSRHANVIGFEMESAGTCEALSSLVIKGVCDYADSHKNKDWQGYAAASAACCAKVFLESLAEIQYQQCASYVYARAIQPFEGQMTDRITSQSVCTWSNATATSDDSDHNQGVQSAHEGLEQFAGEIQSLALRRALVQAGYDAIHSGRSELQMLTRSKTVKSEYRKTLFGTLHFRTQTFKRRDANQTDDDVTTPAETRTSFVFHPARWLMYLGLKYGLNATTTKNQSTWQYSINPVHAVPDNSLIFDFCRGGNVQAVRTLLARGEASIHDTDTSGLNTLHFAVVCGQIDMANFLISQGADRMAHAYKSMHWSDSTPVTFIMRYHSEIHRRDRCSVTAPNMLSLFGDCIEFCEPESNGWSLLEGLKYGKLGQVTPRQAYYWYLFLLREYRQEYSDTINWTSIWSALALAAREKYLDSIQVIMDFVPAERYTEFISSYRCDAIFPRLFGNILWVSKLLADRGMDIRPLFDGETPTSWSMRFSSTFLYWCSDAALIHPVLDLIKQELSEHRAPSLNGWNSKTLRDLFLLKQTERFRSLKLMELVHYSHDVQCNICLRFAEAHYMLNDGAIIEPWWEDVKVSVKSHECLCYMQEWLVDDREEGDIKHICGQGDSRPEPDNDENGSNSEIIVEKVETEIEAAKSPESDPKTSNGKPRYDEEPTNSCIGIEANHSLPENGSLEDNQRPSSPMTDGDRLFDCACPACSSRAVSFAELTQHYHTRYDGWLETYKPGEFYCFRCLAERESWDLEPLHEAMVSALFSDFESESEPDPGPGNDSQDIEESEPGGVSTSGESSESEQESVDPMDVD